jgi:hypothetical protein
LVSNGTVRCSDKSLILMAPKFYRGIPQICGILKTTAHPANRRRLLR